MNTVAETKQINKFNIIAISVYFMLILVLFFNHFMIEKGSMVLAIGLVVAILVCYGFNLFSYIKDRANLRLKYYLSISFFIVYLYVMMVGDTAFRFALVFPPLALMILYHSPNFIFGLGIAAIFVNVLNVVVCYYVFNRTDTESIARYCIQVTTVVLTLVGSWCAAKIYSNSYNKIQEQTQQLENMSLQTVKTIANTIDAKDTYTQGHSTRVAEYSVIIAERMGVDKETQERIGNIASLHDVGKIAVPDTVLNKPAHLSDEEYELMKTHTTAGAEILKDIHSISDVALGAHYHHERYDGKGYPEGLKGKDIPLVARIICLADAFDAMTSNRVYRPPLTKDVVIEEIERGRGTQFDPDCVDAFIDYAKGLNIYYDSENNNVHKKKIELYSLNEDSSKDELTGAHNRLFGENQLSFILERAKGALILVDIVGLKEINMEFGFRRGDHYVKVVADCLKSMVFDDDEAPYIIRFDGNEFLVFVRDCVTKKSAKKWIEEFIARLNKIEDADHQIEKRLGVSCAITIHDNINKNITTHVRELYQSLYFNKRNGDNEYCIYEDNKKDEDVFAAKDDIEDLIEIIKSNSQNTLTSIMGDRDISKTLSMLHDEENGEHVLILFTAKPHNPYSISLERRQHVMALLDDAIALTIRESGTLSSYSSLQRIVILKSSINPPAGWENYIRCLENEILSNFHKNYDKFDMELTCSYGIV